MSSVLTLHKPQVEALPLVFDSPHSGKIYPDDFGYACDFLMLENTEDKYVDDLFSGAPEHGAALLCAQFPRSYIDPNREIDDIDSELLSAPWPEEGGCNPTARSHGGFGLISRLARPGHPVYDRSLSPKEIQSRIQNYYLPYHNALEDLLNEAHYNFGQAWHVNCHSMPAESARPRSPRSLMGGHSRSADFVLGSLDGQSCDHDFVYALRDFLQGLGYHVLVNDPFKGATLIARYAHPGQGRHSLQVEINKSLYMDEATLSKNENYLSLSKDIERFIEFCASYVRAQLVQLAAD